MGFIYESASQAAKDADAYLELIEPGHDSNYSQADYLRIGIASRWTESFWKLMEAMKSRN